jgi:hypothetical protein
VHAECGTVDTELEVDDYGDGTCKTRYVAQTGASAVMGNCTANLFGKTCSSFPGHLLLKALNPTNKSAANYIAPDFQKYLTALGLGGLISAGELSRKFSSVPHSLACAA